MSAPTFTKKDLANRWECSKRTVERAIREFSMRPAGFTGNWPLFTLQQVEAMEKARFKKRLENSNRMRQGDLFA
jgi:hypothetical protein